MRYYIGTSGYSYKAWKSIFYPDDLPPSDMLRFYGDFFDSVEINNTFYKMPNATTLENWADEVPARFKFALKAPRRITHFQRLKRTDDSLSYLLGTAGALGDRLGPLLFQTPPDFQCDLTRLVSFLEVVPKDCRVAFEFRHNSWVTEEVSEVLHEHNAALCLTQVEGADDMPLIPTADWGYLRLRRREYREDDLANWARWIAQQPWREAFVFFKHEDEGKAPQFASAFMEVAVQLQRESSTHHAGAETNSQPL